MFRTDRVQKLFCIIFFFKISYPINVFNPPFFFRSIFLLSFCFINL